MEIRKKLHVTRKRADGFGCTGCIAATGRLKCSDLPPCTVTPEDKSLPSQAFIFVEASSTS